MIKWGRNYRLTIESVDDTNQDDFQGPTKESIVIEYPLTLQFTVNRSMGSSLNTLNCVIYNLSENTRAKIYQDRFGYFGNVRHTVTLEAGYGDDLTVIFIGSLFEAGSTRQGSNILTIISARDGGQDVQNTSTFTTIDGGTSVQAIIKNLIGNFPTLNQGAITDTGQTLKRPVTLDGNTFELLKLYSNQDVFIDLQQVHVVQSNEYVDFAGALPLINADTGLLETPRRNDQGLSVITLFAPQILPSQLIALESTVQKNYNGAYKVISVMHQGIMSGAVNGQCTTTLGLLLDGGLYGNFVPLKPAVNQER